MKTTAFKNGYYFWLGLIFAPLKSAVPPLKLKSGNGPEQIH